MIEPVAPLTDHERRVLAEMEAALGESPGGRRRRATVRRVLMFAIPLACLASVFDSASVVLLPSAAAAAATAVITAVFTGGATAILMSGRARAAETARRSAGP